MTDYLLTLCFDGRNFCGYQIQNTPKGEKRTVGGVLKKALISVFGSVEKLSGCSRTDSGVHATAYRVSFSTDKTLSDDTVIRALNANLPDDVAVFECRTVSPGFHARYSVTSKKYEYRIYTSPVRDPFKNGLFLHYPQKIDGEMLNASCRDFCGTHDFSSFMASGSKITDTVRTVYDASFYSPCENEYVFSVTANGFLYNMVRIMVGTLLEIQSGKLPVGCIPSIIEKKDRFFAGFTAPPDGLYLCEVRYDKY
ncbi:MAG: tRNA pseudouridine(38-40) synthase TruA [Clostridia bacterium]|nr:tRNA pseudouridine(38-40) synthase TruA [Clostridia bacterium]